MRAQRFRDREDAGRRLAAELLACEVTRPIVLALPRGGVPVGYEIARALGAPLDVWVVRKIGVPWHPELGMGAVSEGGHVVLSQELIRQIGLSEDQVAAEAERMRREVERRVRRFRGDRPRPTLAGRTVIVVDDGIATGGTVRAALRSIRAESPKEIVLAVPVASPDTVEELEAEAERVVCLVTPDDLYAIGLWYDDFRQLTDDEVVHLLEVARREQTGQAASAAESRPP